MDVASAVVRMEMKIFYGAIDLLDDGSDIWESKAYLELRFWIIFWKGSANLVLNIK